MFTNDGGYCYFRFQNELVLGNIFLGAIITNNGVKSKSYKLQDENFSSSIDLDSAGAGYSLVGPLTVPTWLINGNDNSTFKILKSSSADYGGRDWYDVFLKKSQNVKFTPSEFWEKINSVYIEARFHNGDHWGANICKLVLWFE